MEQISLKRSASDILNFLRQLGDALDKLQSDKCTIAVCVNIWHELSENTPDEFMLKLSKRRKMALPDVFYAANLLDHRFRGAKLSPVEVAAGMSYISSVNEACLPQVTKYLGYEQPYCRYLFAESYQAVSPTAW